MNIIPRAVGCQITFSPQISMKGLKCKIIYEGGVLERPSVYDPIIDELNHRVFLNITDKETNTDEFILSFTNEEGQEQSILIYTGPGSMGKVEEEIVNAPGLPRTGKDSILLEIAARAPSARP